MVTAPSGHQKRHRSRSRSRSSSSSEEDFHRSRGRTDTKKVPPPPMLSKVSMSLKPQTSSTGIQLKLTAPVKKAAVIQPKPSVASAFNAERWEIFLASRTWSELPFSLLFKATQKRKCHHRAKWKCATLENSRPHRQDLIHSGKRKSDLWTVRRFSRRKCSRCWRTWAILSDSAVSPQFKATLCSCSILINLIMQK